MATTKRFNPAGALSGSVAAPADKSISHRIAMFAAMAREQVTIDGYLAGEDTLSTLTALRTLGANVERNNQTGRVTITGVGLRGADSKGTTIDVGNAGTLMRLIPGWLAGQLGRSFTLDGDASIRRRPIDRIAIPLRQMGAVIEATDERLPPFTVHGGPLKGTVYELPVASAQVKSCVMLAGLVAEGTTSVIEPTASRDHTERLLARLGANVSRAGKSISVSATEELSVQALEGKPFEVPGDLSSAAFPLVAALIVPGSEVRLTGVGVNWTRTGLLDVVARMGAQIEGDWEQRPAAGYAETVTAQEPITELVVKASALVGTTVDADEVPLLIDELPLVALLGVFAEGETIVRGAAELKVKESDRIATVVDGLSALGAQIEATDDGFIVQGTGGLRGGSIQAHGDHRLAMLGAVAGLASAEGVEVIGMDAADVSYPGFSDDIALLLS